MSINVREHTGMGLLNLVFSFGPPNWLPLAKELLANHAADPNMADLDGMTPLMVCQAPPGSFT